MGDPPLRRWALPLLVVLLALSAQADPLADPAPAEEPAFGSPYTGRFRDDPRFRPVLERASALCAQSIETVNRRLGLEYRDTGTIVLRFRDALDLGSRFLFPVPGIRGWTAAETIDGRRRIVVTLHAEFVVAGGHDLARDLAHEMTHAICHERMGEAYQRLPAWIREGSSLWVAREGAALTRYYLGHPSFLEVPQALLEGLDRVEDLSDYPEAWMAFDHLESRAGEEGVRRFLAAVLRGDVWTNALTDVSGEEFPAFSAAARRHALAAVERLADPALPAYRRLFALSCAQNAGADALLAACERFELAHPDSSHLGGCVTLRGRALAHLGRAGEARAAFARVLAGIAMCGFEDDALRRLAELDAAEGNWPAAAAGFARVIGEHPYSPAFADALYSWGLCAQRAGDTETGRRVLRQALASYPSHASAAAARAALRD